MDKNHSSHEISDQQYMGIIPQRDEATSLRCMEVHLQTKLAGSLTAKEMFAQMRREEIRDTIKRASQLKEEDKPFIIEMITQIIDKYERYDTGWFTRNEDKSKLQLMEMITQIMKETTTRIEEKNKRIMRENQISPRNVSGASQSGRDASNEVGFGSANTHSAPPYNNQSRLKLHQQRQPNRTSKRSLEEF